MDVPPSPESSPHGPGSEAAGAPSDGVTADDPTRASPDDAPDDHTRAATERPAHVLTIVVLAVLVVTGLCATVVAVMLTDPAQSIGTASTVASPIAVATTLLAVVIGVVLLERRRGRRTLLAVVVGVSTVGFALSAATLLPLPNLGIHAYGYACPFYVTSIHDTTGMTPDEPLPYGSSIAVATATQRQAWTTFTVSEPINVTAEARKAGQRLPRSGDYYAVPVLRGVADDTVMTCDDPLQALTYWTTAAGTEIEDTPLSMPGYPGGAQGGVQHEDGSVTYYVVFDIAPATARTGTFAMSPLTDGDSPEEVFWGADPGAELTTAPSVTPGAPSASPSDPSDGSSADVYVADMSGPGFSPETPHPFGSGQTMQAVATHADALRFVVSAPIDISRVAHDAGVQDPKGSYIAVPVTSTEIDPAAISDGEGGALYPGDFWLTPGGRMIETADVSVPGYPQLAQVDEPNADGTWSYFEIFDVPSDSTGSGLYQVALSDPTHGTEYVFWGSPRT